MSAATASRPRLRTQRLPRNARFNYARLRAARVLYERGFSVPEIAGLVWQRFGYSSQESCRKTLYVALRSDGVQFRSRGEAKWLTYAEHRCRGCACARDERTLGCRSCAKRHRHRARRGLAHVSRAHDACLGCGCPFDQRTRGCASCTSRHWWRRKQTREAA